MPKTKNRLFRLVQLQAIAFVVVYFLISNLFVVKFITNPNIYISFFSSLIFGSVSVFAFLYLFSHQNFLPFFKNLQGSQDKKEKKYLKSYIKYGKFLACIIVGILGGPIFLALTIRFLFPRSKNKYLIGFVSTFVSTVIVIFFGKSILELIRFKF
ncbi:MAG: hypothetical protein UU16_C0027G0004 [Candidatus Woesebacteria bacterium GW2011_GWA2_40_7]|uniref:Uncharacterized protein n=1 Tax=Candidatus Woesebacteria bacterium GW2011_GWA2_40_7 TaxID=1618562 RepID=A0A0G0T8C1_9BACT|nr:MAG: hypothetical protein UU16_C0027G0004 [Candidatus Woesebacteria bacterium GW2011_GWA2_40_7]